MLNHLTTYLLRHRSVSLPQVGTFQIVQQPAQLAIADKELLPPSFAVVWSEEDKVPDHQLAFLQARLNETPEQVKAGLKAVGSHVQGRIKSGGFEWKGIGTVTRTAKSIALPVSGLQAVPAEKVIRQNARHQVLVGDQERMSDQTTAPLLQASSERNTGVLVVIGWALFLLSLLAIAFFLYHGKFRINASGSKQPPAARVSPLPSASSAHAYPA